MNVCVYINNLHFVGKDLQRGHAWTLLKSNQDIVIEQSNMSFHIKISRFIEGTSIVGKN